MSDLEADSFCSFMLHVPPAGEMSEKARAVAFDAV